MEAATILVVALMTGVSALLLWFEVNSRRNEARLKRELELSQQAQRDREVTAEAEDSDKKVG